MARPRPIDIEALDPDTLEVARAAAESAGMSLEDWLARTLGDPDDDQGEPAADPAPAADPDLTVLATTPRAAPAHAAAPAPGATAPSGGRLQAALHALATSLSTATADPAWAVRIDGIRRATAAAAAERLSDMPAEPPPRPAPPPAAPPVAVAPVQPEVVPEAPPVREPRLGPPQDVPPAPFIPRDAAPASQMQPVSDLPTGGELEKAIAAAQHRRRLADESGSGPRRKRSSGGVLLRLLGFILVVAALAVIAVLAYVWLNPGTSVDEVVEDLRGEAEEAYAGAVSTVEGWIGTEEQPADPVPAEPALPEPADPVPLDPADPATPADLAEPATGDAMPEAQDGDANGAVEPLVAPEPEGGADVGPAAPESPLAALQREAENGDLAAQRTLGLRYLEGDGVAADPAVAYSWLERSAASGDPQSQYLLGTLYESGTGIEADPLIAMAWYMSAADAGIAEASLRLGEIYRDGEQWPQSYPDAADSFRTAADAGQAEGAFELAELYSVGLGVDRSPVLAHAWFSRAVDMGLAAASARADEVAAALTPEQLALSAELAANPPPTDTRLYGAEEPEGSNAEPGAPESGALAAPESDTAAAPDEPPAETVDLTAPEQPDASAPIQVAPIPEPQTPTARLPADGTTVVTPGNGVALGVEETPVDDPLAETEEAAADDQLPGSELSPAAIQEIQALLNNLGYESGRPDGIPGRRTVQAIQAYQAAQGLPVTGEPSLTLLARLRSQPPP